MSNNGTCDILFYSTQCVNCNEVISFIQRNELDRSSKISFISLDNRRIKSGCVFAVLHTNEEYPIPPCVSNVPTMINRQNYGSQIVITGSSKIISYLEDRHKLTATKANAEPDSCSTLGYSGMSVYNAGFTEIPPDTISQRKEPVHLEKYIQDRNSDVRMEHPGMVR
jgi:hypothetical protein